MLSAAGNNNPVLVSPVLVIDGAPAEPSGKVIEVAIATVFANLAPVTASSAILAVVTELLANSAATMAPSAIFAAVIAPSAICSVFTVACAIYASSNVCTLASSVSILVIASCKALIAFIYSTEYLTRLTF